MTMFKIHCVLSQERCHIDLIKTSDLVWKTEGTDGAEGVAVGR